MEPDKTSLWDQLIAFVVGARHGVSGDKGQVNDFKGSIFVYDARLLTKLSEWVARDSPDVSKRIPRTELFVQILYTCVAVPKKVFYFILVSLHFHQIWQF